jgi:hypothetical protein
LTDDILSNIRRHNSLLRSLSLNGCKALTAAGLEAFFTMEITGLPPPPMLRTLKLASCHYETVTDNVVELAALASSRKLHPYLEGTFNRFQASERVDDAASFCIHHHGSSTGGLIDLDVRGSKHVTDTSMEVLASTCAFSLRSLNVSFCPFVSDKGLGYLVSKANHLQKIEIWGCGQITDDFLDGHSRTDDGNLEIVGAWMKMSGASSVRS